MKEGGGCSHKRKGFPKVTQQDDGRTGAKTPECGPSIHTVALEPPVSEARTSHEALALPFQPVY